MGAAPRMTRAMQGVLEALLVDPTAELSGLEVSAGAGIRNGAVHSLLAQLEGRGWVESRWEDLDHTEPEQLPRRCYRLTGVGATLAGTAVQTARRGAPRLRWRPIPGSS